jgi:choline kinase
MKAIILAAGPGTRMLPHTEERPKCLMKVGGHAILDYQLAALRQCGIDDICIVVGYLADRIREHVSVPVTFVENAEYGSTGSSYSLWLARTCMRDGFIYLNSDLIFHPSMLRALLDSPHANAVVVDRRISPTSDMQKAQMDGDRILRMNKHLPEGLAHAEVVGPAKFDRDGAARIVAYLDQLVAAGDRNRWSYEVFGLVAEQLTFAGVDNPDCFWAEVDTPTEALDANQRIPPSLVDLAGRRIEPAPPIERRRAPAIDVQPVLYLDHLLNAHFAPLVEDIPDADRQVRNVVRRNKQEFIDCVEALGVGSLSAIQLHRELQRMVEAIDEGLEDTYARDIIYSTGGLTDMMSAIFARTPEELRTGYCLTDAAAAELLQSHPPKTMMDALGYRSTAELLRREWPRAALALTRATEDPDWQVRYKTLLSQRTAADFEERPIEYVSVDAKRYRAAFMNSKQPAKLWRITHSKEAGVVAALTPDGIASFRAPLLQYVLVYIHYFFETAFASKYYRHVSERSPERVGAEVVNTIDAHREKLTFFYSNLYSENLFWDRALDLFAEIFPGPEMAWFGRARARGEYCLSTGVQNIVVSLNVIDHLWNVNFLSHAGMEAFQHDTIYFLYHFRGALWQEVVNELTGLGAARERVIVENLGLGDTRLTRQLFDEVRRDLSARVTAATS